MKIQSVCSGVPQPHTVHTHENLGFGAQEQNTPNLGIHPRTISPNVPEKFLLCYIS